jgi:CBS domain-containing protein
MIGESIDTMKLRRKGLNVATDIGVNVMSVTLVRDIMNTNVISALDTMTVGEARLRLLPSNHTIYPVTDQHGVFKGIIKLENLRLASDDDRRGIQAIMDASDAQVYPTDTVLTALRQIESSRDPRIIVIDKKTRQLRGIVSPVDFVRLSSAEVQESI